MSLPGWERHTSLNKRVLDGALRYGERPSGRLKKPLLERVVEEEEGFSKQRGNGRERRKERLGSCIHSPISATMQALPINCELFRGGLTLA